MELDPTQSKCLKSACAWYRKDPAQRPPFYLVKGPAGSGKQQPVDCIVQTPGGPRRIGDLQLGDFVLAPTGLPVRVMGIFPQGIQQAYRITFRDGFHTEAGAEHLWLTKTGRHPWTIRTTNELLAKGLRDKTGNAKYRIPLTEAVQYPVAELPLDPYFLGAMIGDGTSLGRSPILCNPDPEIWDRCRAVIPEYARMKDTDNSCSCPRHHFVNKEGPKHGVPNQMALIFKSLSLNVKSPERFIPQLYLMSSVAQRLELLRGLMDTDGACLKNRTIFSTKSPKLRDDICSLVQSLGGTAIALTMDRGEKGIEYHVNVKTPFCPFHFSRKAQQWKPSTKNPPSRYIFSIEPSRVCEQVCIQVDSPDGLYLTDHYIVTHNSTLIQHIIAEAQPKKVVCLAPTGKAALVMRGKGFPKARTVHSAIYMPKGNLSDEKLTKQLHTDLDVREDALRATGVPEEEIALDKDVQRIKAQLRRTKEKPLFDLCPSEEIEDCDLIVLSEASMVNEHMARDLLNLEKPILCEGDPFQLPPVEGKATFMDEATRDNCFTLEVIHRQAEGSPILQMAKLARMGAGLELGDYGDGCAVVESVSPELALAANQIIVGRNATRHDKNWDYRLLKGFVTDDMRPHQEFLPRPGERLICRKNDNERGLLNGSFWICEEAVEAGESQADQELLHITMTSEDDAGLEMTCLAHKELLKGPAQRELTTYQARARGVQKLDFGYCITGHLSQGSQFDFVIVYDESSQFPDWRKWLYTAVTRAAKRLIVVKDYDHKKHLARKAKSKS